MESTWLASCSLSPLASKGHYRPLTLTVLVTTIDAQWEGMGDVGSGEVRAGTTSPMPDHKGFKLQQLVNFQKFSTLRVKISTSLIMNYKIYMYVIIAIRNMATDPFLLVTS